MSEDRAAEILRDVSAMARDFGEHRQEMKEFRHEFNQFREETNARLGSLEQQFTVFKRELRQLSQFVNRVVAVVVGVGTDVEELQDRLTLLEGKGS